MNNSRKSPTTMFPPIQAAKNAGYERLLSIVSNMKDGDWKKGEIPQILEDTFANSHPGLNETERFNLAVELLSKGIPYDAIYKDPGKGTISLCDIVRGTKDNTLPAKLLFTIESLFNAFKSKDTNKIWKATETMYDLADENGNLWEVYSANLDKWKDSLGQTLKTLAGNAGAEFAFYEIQTTANNCTPKKTPAAQESKPPKVHARPTETKASKVLPKPAETKTPNVLTKPAETKASKIPAKPAEELTKTTPKPTTLPKIKR